MSEIVGEDGVDFINVYSKGKTILGRMLSNFYKSPFYYEGYGNFASVEAFWYYFLTGCRHENLKRLYGFTAKEKGRTYYEDRTDKDGLSSIQKEIILEAIRCKIRQNKQILNLMKSNTLPFVHYYEYGGKRVYPKEHNWMIDELNRIGKILNKEKK